MIGAVGQIGPPGTSGSPVTPERVGDSQIEGLLVQLDGALNELEMLPDGQARTASVEAVQVLLLVYGEAMQRMVDRVGSISGDEGLRAFMNDQLIDQLMVLHDVHPQDVEVRAERALDQVRPYLQSHGGDVEFLGIADGVARLRLNGSCDGCPSSTVTLKTAVEDALKGALPEVLKVEAVGEEPVEPGGSGRAAFIPTSEISFGRPGCKPASGGSRAE